METTTTTQSLDLFMTALLGQNYSPKTLRAYRDDLKQFITWVGENRVDWDQPRRFKVLPNVKTTRRLCNKGR
jgi:site-specific recombinase XerD